MAELELTARQGERALHAPSNDRDMMRIPGGTFRMGSDRHYPEEAPVHRVTVDTSTSHVGFRCIVRSR
jgi:formylglycine-generating enzyme required for sulfatase activity